jgi:probable rRNA maturation factor
MGREALTVRVAGLSALPRSARRPALIEGAVRRAFALEAPRLRGEVAVVFVDRARMRALNRQYLGHDYDTDVLAFAHERAPGVPAGEAPIGDVYVSGWMAARQARELGHAVLREALTLAAHGALHLLGHDDASARGRARMFRRQDEIVAWVGA